MKLCKKQKFLVSRLQRPVAALNDVIAKKLVADDTKTGLLAARAISSAMTRSMLLHNCSNMPMCFSIVRIGLSHKESSSSKNSPICESQVL